MSLSLNAELEQTGHRLLAALQRPTVSGIYLPAPVEDETFRDEFGFVLLSDGGIGPFYVSLGDLLQTLWERLPQPAAYRAEVPSLMAGFAATDPAARALALGAYNALSASLMRRVGFVPPDRAANSGVTRARNGRPVGMVGYFCPLVDRLTDLGCELMILEQAPQRVPVRAGVRVTTDVAALHDCGTVLCTASTLVNDSLEPVLAAVDPQARFELIGPSGSGIPDPLLARGVDAVGGVLFSDQAALLAHLVRGESWGTAGRKYQIDADGYPGLDALLRRLPTTRQPA